MKTIDCLDKFHAAELQQQLVSIEGRLASIERESLNPNHHRTYDQDERQRSMWIAEVRNLKAERKKVAARLTELLGSNT